MPDQSIRLVVSHWTQHAACSLTINKLGYKSVSHRVPYIYSLLSKVSLKNEDFRISHAERSWWTCSVLMLYSLMQLYVYIYMRKQNQQYNDERTQFFRKIYLSHFIRNGCEKVMCERWVGDWTNCNILTPSSFVFSSTSFLFCYAAQSGVLRAHSPLLSAGSLYSILSTTNWLQLTELPVAPGSIIVWHPPASCEHCICIQFDPSTVKVISWYLRPDAPVPWLTAGSKVNMLHLDRRRIWDLLA